MSARVFFLKFSSVEKQAVALKARAPLARTLWHKLGSDERAGGRESG